LSVMDKKYPSVEQNNAVPSVLSVLFFKHKNHFDHVNYGLIPCQIHQ
jgi:hypothetical protein